VKAWVVDGTNLLQAMPDRARTLEAIHALDLLVVIDTVPSEIASYADVVLPEAMYLERFDALNDDCLRVPFLALRQPVVEPPHQQKPGWWIGQQLGERLGVEQVLSVARYRGLPENARHRRRLRLERTARQGRAVRSASSRSTRRTASNLSSTPFRQGRVLVEAAGRQEASMRFRSTHGLIRDRRQLPAADRTRADAHVLAHGRQSPAGRADGRKRSLGQRRRRPRSSVLPMATR
jgi:anaerobic selenocysteine-containing dehydrogenase